MYVIYPADEVVSLTYSSHSLPRPRQRPTLDLIFGPPPLVPSRAQTPAPSPAPPRAVSVPKTAPPEPAQRAPASPTPSIERPAKPRERTKAKLFKKLGRHEDTEFGKIVRTPAPDEFELPAPLPTPAFSRKNIFDRDFDALFEVASTPEFCANIRVTTPEPDRRSDVSAPHFPSPSTSSLSLLPPRPQSEPTANCSPAYSPQSTPPTQRSSFEGTNAKPKKVSFFRKFSRSRESPSPQPVKMQQPSLEMALRELTHPSHNEQLKNQQQVTFKLVKTVASIYKYISTYQEDTIRFTTRTDYLDWNTTFPSITICEIGTFDKLLTKATNEDKENAKNMHLVKDIVFFRGDCPSCISTCENKTECSIDFARLTSVYRSECKDLFISCTWDNKPMNCCQHFKAIETEYGVCFSMNNIQFREQQFSYYVASSDRRDLGSLTVALSQDYEAFLHSHEDVPFWNMEQDRRISVEYGMEATVLFSIADIENEPEVSLSVPNVRQCRFPDEVPSNFRGFGYYSYSVCIIQCRIEEQLRLCDCTSHLSPAVYEDQYCDLEGLQCLTKHYDRIKKLKVPGVNDTGLECDCLSSCTEPDYNIIAKKVRPAEGSAEVADFTTQLSQVYERHSAELQVLVANFRKRNSELRKERASCPSSLFHTWETFLQEVEADVVGFSNASTSLERSVATPLVEKTFHMKVQARKLFAHREGCEVILGKADDQLNKSRQDYRAAFLNYCDNSSPANLATYYDSHNNYVQQLTATNAMIEQYHKHTLPTILQELEEILTDVTSAVSDAICQDGEIISEKCTHQLRRYESLCAQSRAVSSTADLAHLARTLLINQPPLRTPKRNFLPPYPPEPDDPPIDVPAVMLFFCFC
ncbi:unnamed protein product [Colias eurytheme]|nr:unnamed protein product [Colias eurytheme]